MRPLEFRHLTKRRPRRKKPGEVAFYLPQAFADKKHEIALSIMFSTNRKLFGHAYSGLRPEYFRKMPENSGAYITFAVSTRVVNSEVQKPGDIDILIVPYEGEELILHESVAVEVKALRASFIRQGKSPNEFGFSQARGLQTIGFPFVAIAHLIVSDASPREAWREMGVARVLDNEGRVELLDPVLIDCMPMDLIDRSFGRLTNLSHDASLGLVAAYIEAEQEKRPERLAYWHPDTREAHLNAAVRRQTLERVAEYFDRFPERFLDNPRHDPR